MEWSRPHAMEYAAALGLGLAGALLLARRAARSPDARSLVLVALRGSALAILVLILLDPVRVATTRVPGERPEAVFLYDGSRSMALERPTSRLGRVEGLASEARAAVAPGRLPPIARYRFGRELAAIADGEAPRPLDDESKLRDALERLPSRFGATLPSGVFVLSDGRSSESTGFDQVARGYAKLGVPIHVVPAGDASISGDVAIRDLIIPRSAPKGTKVPVRVLVQSRGFEGRRAEVSIRPAVGQDPKPLATLPLTLADGDQPTELVIEADRARGGLVAEVSPQVGEAIAENNRVPFRIASRNRKIRVIYMEGSSATPEYRFIRDALVEDPQIECVAMETDVQTAGRSRLHRVDDPSRGYPTTREELLGYDVVICSDISRATFTPDQLEWTVELVAKRGGGFAMIGGHTSFGSGGWDRTPWDAMIPIDMSGGGGSGQISPYHDGDFKVVVPPAAQAHPIWRIVDDPDKNREILDRMPPFHGTNLTDRLKPAAVLLGISDRRISGFSPPQRQPPRGGRSRKQAGGTQASTEGSPIFSAQPYGRGRSLAMSTDSTYAWGTDFETSWGEGDNRYFRKFWRNVVTWLAENSVGAEGRLELATDKVIYRPGQSIAVTARAFDDKLEPSSRYRLVARLGPEAPAPASPPTGRGTPMTLAPSGFDFLATLPVPSVEQFRRESGSASEAAKVEVTAFDGDQVVGRSSIDVQFLDDSEEYRDPRPDPARLQSLAKQSGGTVVRSAGDLARLLESSTEAADRVVTSRSPAWDSPWILTLLFGLLAAEWALRRRKGLA